MCTVLDSSSSFSSNLPFTQGHKSPCQSPRKFRPISPLKQNSEQRSNGVKTPTKSPIKIISSLFKENIPTSQVQASFSKSPKKSSYISPTKPLHQPSNPMEKKLSTKSSARDCKSADGTMKIDATEPYVTQNQIKRKLAFNLEEDNAKSINVGSNKDNALENYAPSVENVGSTNRIESFIEKITAQLTKNIHTEIRIAIPFKIESISHYHEQFLKISTIPTKNTRLKEEILIQLSFKAIQDLDSTDNTEEILATLSTSLECVETITSCERLNVLYATLVNQTKNLKKPLNVLQAFRIAHLADKRLNTSVDTISPYVKKNAENKLAYSIVIDNEKKSITLLLKSNGRLKKAGTYKKITSAYTFSKIADANKWLAQNTVQAVNRNPKVPLKENSIAIMKALHGKRGLVTMHSYVEYIKKKKDLPYVTENKQMLLMDESEGDLCVLKGKLSSKELIQVLLDIGYGINEMHNLGIIHGDMKPANVLYTKDNATGTIQAFINDFDMSFYPETEKPTFKGYGTSPYAAPHTVLGTDTTLSYKEEMKARDMHAIGLIMFELMNQFPYMMKKEQFVTQVKTSQDIVRTRSVSLPGIIINNSFLISSNPYKLSEEQIQLSKKLLETQVCQVEKKLEEHEVLCTTNPSNFTYRYFKLAYNLIHGDPAKKFTVAQFISEIEELAKLV